MVIIYIRCVRRHFYKKKQKIFFILLLLSDGRMRANYQKKFQYNIKTIGSWFYNKIKKIKESNLKLLKKNFKIIFLCKTIISQCG